MSTTTTNVTHAIMPPFEHQIIGDGQPIFFFGNTGRRPASYSRTLEHLATYGRVYAFAHNAFTNSSFSEYVEKIGEIKRVFTHGDGIEPMMKLYRLSLFTQPCYFTLIDPSEVVWRAFSDAGKMDVIVTSAESFEQLLHTRAYDRAFNHCMVRARPHNPLYKALDWDLKGR
jgi:hypothetical protein